MKVYKIRRKSDGFFSNGGSTPGFTKRGKLWKGMGPLNNHINILYKPSVYADCELVTFELVEEELDRIDLSVHVAERTRLKAEKEDAYQQRIEEFRKKRRYEEFLKLQNEFGEK
mgnify:CR=1 FL=1